MIKSKKMLGNYLMIVYGGSKRLCATHVLTTFYE